MGVTRSHRLKIQLTQYVRQLRQTLYDEIGRDRVKRNDLPAMADACRLNKRHDFGHSRSCHKVLWESVTFVPPLKVALENHGTLFTPNWNHGHKVFVGSCAEDVCANKVLQSYYERHHSYPDLSEIRFIQPVRPRTNQCKKFCEVCKDVFSL